MNKLLLLACALVPIAAYAAAGTQTGTVSYVNVRASDGLVFFRIVGGTKTGGPACATGDYWIIRDENSNAGKQQYTMLLAAQASGKVVNISGLNSCNRWVNGEDVDFIQIND